tara:strand:- start:6626 stop:6805 length:180 start_codon:yes stop_codon:yes gene_type:complete
MKLSLLAIGALVLPMTVPTPVGVGGSLGDLPIEGISQSGAASIEDYAGRAILVEFFAYW